ncbi:hypothetical protein ASPSYDRAFT_49359 [Aspergillus sydowii CBS 593.65]|uniref:Uncharacterized protein n=1 Tax=Aspergillus sydowii CBS 593.65 TaxID=1036612 RepID=A0A1L9T6W4_9EURO|nr:uncharacterized protein ASPSYDRAFT_49359 [Aspergillus sydowii CBS 593.65]OJJ55190.1 hypothetical protein ASPSYDRAFT_49359 [Aspergillus sydowii CBS 593.65]
MAAEKRCEAQEPPGRPARMARAVQRFILHWSPVGRNQNRRTDKELCDVWRTPTGNVGIASVVADELPDSLEECALEEEPLRHWIRHHCRVSDDDDDGTEKSSAQMQPEETLPDVPPGVRNLLAALNMAALETELRQLSELDFLHQTDKDKLRGLAQAITAKTRMWRQGFRETVSVWYRLLVQAFFALLVFLLLIGTVAAFIRDERAYNARMIGPRVIALVQLFYIWKYEFHTLWLLYSWSLERVFGAAIGNLSYFLAAVSPVIGAASEKQVFKMSVLAFSIVWQMGVQFWDAVWNEGQRWAARYRIRRRLKHQSACKNYDIKSDSGEVYGKVLQTIRTSQSYQEDIATGGYSPVNYEVSLRIRVERLLLFANKHALGRAADQDFQLFSGMLEEFVNVFLDYESSLRPPGAEYVDNGYKAPRGPKIVLVGAATVIFAVSCYSFKDQELTFNTVVPYSVVVLIKQSLAAWKRYYSVRAANRMFSNMVAFNIWAFFLVSLPLLIDEQVFDSDLCMAVLTLAMTFATCFLTEPIAPIIQNLMELAFPHQFSGRI